jgi:hypothetical protein
MGVAIAKRDRNTLHPVQEPLPREFERLAQDEWSTPSRRQAVGPRPVEWYKSASSPSIVHDRWRSSDITRCLTLPPKTYQSGLESSDSLARAEDDNAPQRRPMQQYD